MARCSADTAEEETHRARMFSLHDIIHMSKRGKEVNRKCAMHGEPQIMFSTTKRTMLCITCFRESSIDARHHCIDLETAYTQGCKKLDRAVMVSGHPHPASPSLINFPFPLSDLCFPFLFFLFYPKPYFVCL
ncbi:RING finger protein 207 [Chionoecetes opilio]|uniref:RING finger protein 207 n=1 Tax=Chionoecetes opilio TaxID=41210 RepID=A0A8J4YGD8_CHIOP|nr:RING finger protein 207 [Chionoecetes opilio]